MRFKENSLPDITCFSRAIKRGIHESGNEFCCKTHFLYVIYGNTEIRNTEAEYGNTKYGSSQVGIFEQIFLLLDSTTGICLH